MNEILTEPRTELEQTGILKNTKGILLCGGAGSRLYPLTTSIPKSILPVYNKPTIFYPLNTLKKLGCIQVLIICQYQYFKLFQNLLQDGSEFGMDITYGVQDEPKGIAEAFIIGEEFIGKDDVILGLGDNIFIMDDELKNLSFQQQGEYCNICGVKVEDASKYGVYIEDKNIIIEKPPYQFDPCLNYAIPGIYKFDSSVCNKAKILKPSPRGELEITDLLQLYLKQNNLFYTKTNNMIWFDTGNFDDLLDAGNTVKSIEHRLGRDLCDGLYI